jgi:sterol desaturase/sphingolipid hydroxylase (fatty acid hydroxylase superfamily)
MTTMNDMIKQLGELLFFGLPIHIATILIFSIIERFVPAGSHKPISGWWLNLKIMVVYNLAPILASVGVGASVAAVGSRLGLGWIDLRFSKGHGIPIVIFATLLTLFIGDFFYYWFHRFQHKVPFLWHEHKLHHMDEQLSAITSGRHHWLEDLLRVPVVTIPMAILFKLDPISGGMAGYIIGAWPVFFHANLRIHLGRASVLFNCPQVHRIHHSRLREHYDQNFAGFFPIWDVLFGTYHHPALGEFPASGVAGEREVRTAREAASLPFREWRRMWVEWRMFRTRRPT